MTTGGYEAAEAGARARAIMESAIIESARARALAKASQVITTAVADETELLILGVPGRLSPSDPRWADYWAGVERIRGLSHAEVIALGIASDQASQDALEQVAVRVRETGVKGDSSPMLLLLVVLMWLIAVGLPVVQAELPGEAQGIAINEATTVGLALAITWRIFDKRGKGGLASIRRPDLSGGRVGGCWFDLILAADLAVGVLPLTGPAACPGFLVWGGSGCPCDRRGV